MLFDKPRYRAWEIRDLFEKSLPNVLILYVFRTFHELGFQIKEEGLDRYFTREEVQAVWNHLKNKYK